jgi:hypothetical protein
MKIIVSTNTKFDVEEGSLYCKNSINGLPAHRDAIIQKISVKIRASCARARVCIRTYRCKNMKVKQSRYRPGVAPRVPGGLGSQSSWHSAREVGEVVSLTHRPPLPPGMFLVLIFTRGWVDPRTMVRWEGNIPEKFSDTTGNRSRDRQTSSAAP